jgi:hypothetical protein
MVKVVPAADPPVSPAVCYGQPAPDWWVRSRRDRLVERHVTVANPDGTTTEHTFWTDGHLYPHVR